jgi:serine/threonine protein phosphatase 1
MKNRTFVIGDIHGAYKALVQCLARSGFNFKEDTLITLGDIADGWSEVPECIETLLKIPNGIHLIGNHDTWAYEWLKFGMAPSLWLHQGGKATFEAYNGDYFHLKEKHLHEFFEKQHNSYIDDENRAFVHGGYVDNLDDHLRILTWDRSLWNRIALSGHKSQKLPKKLRIYKEIFIGHTSTMMYDIDKPMNRCNVWNLDTGAGWYGKLTIMDVDTKEYWQSDPVQELYQEEKGRR